MKFAIPEISWHNRDPVLSVDFQPKAAGNEPLRLATGGTDSHVLIWYVCITESGSVNIEVAADLARHQKAVNVVRWSPNGQYLASGDDESIIFVWKLKTEEPVAVLEGEEQYKETWVIHKTLRGHMEDVLDLSWSPDSMQIASGSVDNKLLVWDVAKGKYSAILSDHKGFVQGVSWDPKGQLIASASTDRVVRTFDVTTKKVVSRSSKAVLPFPSGHALHGLAVRLYHDDTLQTFYRRLAWSPDGLLLAVPAGRPQADSDQKDTKPINAVYIYTRYSLKVPVCVVPCGGEPALALRWAAGAGGARAARGGGPAPAFPAYPRRLLAVATRRSLLIYDTQQRTPIALLSNIHYTRLTDLTWSPDGRALLAASTDGFCSIITFGARELGELAPEQDPPSRLCAPEPMEVQTEEHALTNTKGITEDPKLSKMDAFIKFKAPEKSPKKQKIQPQIKTPVKIDLMEEVAMPSWSDNSSSEIIRPKPTEPMDISEVTVIEDSEDIKLVYDETEGTKTQSPKETRSAEANNQLSSPKSPSAETKSSHEMKSLSAKTKSTSTKTKSPLDKTKSPPAKTQSPFLRQARVTDVKQQGPLAAAPTLKTPRRVNLVTLSSPKNKKKC